MNKRIVVVALALGMLGGFAQAGGGSASAPSDQVFDEMIGKVQKDIAAVKKHNELAAELVANLRALGFVLWDHCSTYYVKPVGSRCPNGEGCATILVTGDFKKVSIIGVPTPAEMEFSSLEEFARKTHNAADVKNIVMALERDLGVNPEPGKDNVGECASSRAFK